jgi:LPXTG-motif cell wall-anchored protein
MKYNHLIKLIQLAVLLSFLISLLSLLSISAAAETMTIDYHFVNATLIGQNPDPAEPGEIVELRFNVWNGGAGIIENVKFELVPEWPLSFVSGQSPKISVGDLKTKNIYDDKSEDTVALLYYRLKVDPKAPSGDYQVVLKYTASNKLDVEQKLPVFTVRVESSTSLLDIDNFQTIPAQIKPGSTGKLMINLANKGGVNLKDIKVKLDLDDLGFSPIGSTNEKVISSLTRDTSTVASFELFASADIKAKEYQVPVLIEYKNDNNTKYTKNNTLTLLIDSTPFYLLNLEQADVSTANTKGKIVISLSNTGQSDLKYLNLELLDTDDYEVLGKRSEYLGNLESDDYETADFQIFVKDIAFPGGNKKRNIPLNLKISYKDGYNKDYSEEKEVPLPVYTTSMAKKLGLVSSSVSTSTVIVILLIVGGAGYYFYRKRKKTQEPLSKK